MRGLRLCFNRETGEPLRYEIRQRDGTTQPGEGHFFVAAPTRMFKTSSFAVPALLDWEDSCITIDTKEGELTSLCGPEAARMGKRVFIHNSFKIWPRFIGPEAKQFEKVRNRCVFDAHYNPNELLDPASDAFGATADFISEGFIAHDIGGGDDAAHFSEGGRELASGILMRLAERGNPEENNLVTLRRLVSNPSKLFAFAKDAVKNSRDDIVCDRLAPFADDTAADSKEIGGLLSTVRVQSRFLGNKAVANSLSGRSSFRFADAKREPVAIFIVLPVRHVPTCSKLLRLLLTCALFELLQEE